MEHAGYRWTAGVVNAAAHGSPQSRQRLLYVAIRGDVGVDPVIHAPTHGSSGKYFSYRCGCMKKIEDDVIDMLGITPATRRMKEFLPYWETDLGPGKVPRVGEVLDGLPRIGTTAAERLDHRPWSHTPATLARMARVPEGGRWNGGMDHFSQSYGRLHRRGLARTITGFFPNAGSGRYWHPRENRALTLREAARIQGFPDSFSFIPPYSKAAALVGNALDSTLAGITYSSIRSCL